MIAARFSLALFVFLFLAACNGASLQTIWKLLKIDLATLEPSQVRIAINAPEWMGPMLDDLQLSIRMQPSGREVTSGLFQLRRVKRPEDIVAIQRAGLAVDNLSIFEFASKELERIRKFQSQMNTLINTEDGETEERGVDSYRLQRKGRAICLSHPPPDASTTVDIYLYPTAEIGWVLFDENVDVREFDLADSVTPLDEAACRNSHKNSPGNDAGGEAVARRAEVSGVEAKKLPKKLNGGVSIHSGK